jgi:hypothetical protein
MYHFSLQYFTKLYKKRIEITAQQAAEKYKEAQATGSPGSNGAGSLEIDTRLAILLEDITYR